MLSSIIMHWSETKDLATRAEEERAPKSHRVSLLIVVFWFTTDLEVSLVISAFNIFDHSFWIKLLSQWLQVKHHWRLHTGMWFTILQKRWIPGFKLIWKRDRTEDSVNTLFLHLNKLLDECSRLLSLGFENFVHHVRFNHFQGGGELGKVFIDRSLDYFS